MSDNNKPLAFRNTDLSLDVRIADLIAQLTIDEKIAQLLHEAPAIERLDIKPYSWWNEALHGVARAGSATIFPQAIALASTFDRNLVGQIASVISDEARAKYEIWAKKGRSGRYLGLTFWTPNINIFRDPRWGRGQETYGEDPYLTGEIGVEFVRGLQGDDPHYLKTAACAKHFAVHSGPEKVRHVFDAKASPYDLEDTYLPAFKKLVEEAKVESVMGAYNRTNGEPCCGSKFLLVDILRKKWGFKGHVVSDCWALVDFHTTHKVTSSPAESAALALKMGCDLNCGCTFPHLVDALVQGLVVEADIDLALSRLLSTRFRLGEFDPPAQVAYRHLSPSLIRCQKHLDLSYEAAIASMVLLKNDGLLPLKKEAINSIYLTGPNAISVEALIGNYYGLSPRMVTFVEGLCEEAGIDIKFEFRHGSLLTGEKQIESDWAAFEVKEFDLTIAFMGLNLLLEGEEGDSIAATAQESGDRADLGLPKGQHDFLSKIMHLGKPIILVVSAGCPIDLSPYYEHVAAIVYSWYPGELGGKALSDLLFGKRDFSGKLPLTFPMHVSDLPAYDDYSMQGRTYRYAQTKPMFPFGFGLSYQSARVQSFKSAVSIIGANQDLILSATVLNPHAHLLDSVVQVYLKKKVNGYTTPNFELAGFERLHLSADESRNLQVTIKAEQLECIGKDGKRTFVEGDLEVFLGFNQPDLRSLELGSSACKSLTLTMA